MSDAETLKVYAEKAGAYVAMTKTAGLDPRVASFIARLPARAHVLDLGCGPGQEAGAMAAAGMQVTAYDAVPEMVALAAAHPGVSAYQATFEDITGADIYDGVWANFSLLHAPRADMPRHLAQIAMALKPGGLFHIALKSGTGSKRDRMGRFYSYYTDSELTGLLQEAGFTVTDLAAGEGKGLDGAVSPWISLTAHG
ncbi:bifunctional 2-polyprenyl-6-hydroxyphenol methylase/3-demethylubiquinol 3-O-methyltransferase UbiG [Roseobacter fucihabitans]|uniref:class I SAM-dependent methyltransferase n=1 Tax=Roseobacter fucihabitans TaxID=1537242 RepID=UPI00165310DC|nr:class I SAM-dependent methyltransferase [Roseobacter litoralis]